MASVGGGWDVDPEIQSETEFRWYKVKPGRGLDLVVLSDEPVWYAGHYDEKRMRLCLGEGCERCRKQMGKQVRYCMAVAETTTQRPGLIEVGDVVGREIRDMSNRFGRLRGLHIFVQKHSLSKNSRMEIDYCEGAVGEWWKFISPPNVRQALVLTWEKMGVPEDVLVRYRREPEGDKRFPRPKSAVIGI